MKLHDKVWVAGVVVFAIGIPVPGVPGAVSAFLSAGAFAISVVLGYKGR